MKVKNKSKRLICLQTKEGRVDLLPNAITDDSRIDSVKDNKVFKALLESEDIVEVAGEARKTPKELLVAEALSLSIDTTDMTVDMLKEAIAEAKGGGE